MTLLYLDLDGAIPRDFDFRCARLLRMWNWHLALEAIRYDKTRRGWHVVIALRQRLPPTLIVAAQAILGSDAEREAFNLMRVQSLRHQSRYFRQRWNVLYSGHSRGLTVT